MDFLDPQKQRAYHIRLMIGYVLVAIAIVLATVVLIYQANGYGVKQGKVIQNGLIFVHARPAQATVTLNDQPMGGTDARLTLEAGTYTIKLARPGYRNWQRAITVEGGSVEHFDYVLMVPSKLVPTKLNSYQTAPTEMTQSPDRQWLLVRQAGQLATYDQYNIKDPKKTAATHTVVSVPTSVIALPATTPAQQAAQSLEAVEWSNDNDHVLLRHADGAQFEYILFSRKTPSSSVNLTKSLQLTPNQKLSLEDKRYDRYFVQDQTTHTLSTATLADKQSTPMLTNVLDFKSYGTDTVLYTSSIFNKTDKVQLKLYQDRKQYNIRTLEAAPSYLLAISRYDNSWLIAAGTSADNKVYVYKDPADALKTDPTLAPASVSVLKIANPTNVAFSASSEMVMAENGTNFAVYDAEYDRTHNFSLDAPMDAPQLKAVWVDSHHLSYVSDGKVVLVDYDGTNFQTLGNQLPAQPPLFDTGYITLYTLAKPETIDAAKPDTTILSATSLLTPADQ